MKDFLKYTLASCLGMVVAVIILSIIGFISIAGFVSFLSSEEDQVSIPESGVIEIKLDQLVPEKTNNAPISPFAFSFDQQNIVGLQDMIRLIEYAKTDDKIQGIYINLSGNTLADASAYDLRKAIEDFKTTEKFVFANSDYYDQRSYYLASVADSIYIHPTGTVDFRGFGVMIPFIKGMLDKIGVEARVFYAGDFKSATEPIRRKDMSEANREQTKEYIRDLYNTFLNDIAASRNTTPEALEAMADKFEIQFTEDALQHGLVDRIVYEDQFIDAVRQRVHDDTEKEVNIISMNKYFVKHKKDIAKISGEKEVAIVYFEGGIVVEGEDPATISSERYVKLLREIREKDKLAAVVIRVNSGGGSALASDKIAREIQLIRDKGIPVVSSMGDLAASGGYYIAAPADVIFAAPNTLTGSIGVFAVIPQARELLQDKIGLTFDTVATGPFATSFNVVSDFSSRESNFFQSSVDSIYQQFLRHVAQARNMTVEEVHDVAQGRVWSGQRASELQLVDEIGNMQDALNRVIEIAEVSDYKIREYPKTKNPLEKLLENLGDQGGSTPKLKKQAEAFLAETFPQYQIKKEYESMKGVQMKLPFYLQNKQQKQWQLHY